MKAHVIENGVVINTIEVESLEFLPNLVEATEGGIGWSYDNGVFTAPVVVVSDEETAQQVRSKRDSLLTESDWTQVADAPVDQEAWATYRQALRDIPSQAGFPNTVNWPVEP
jgi:homogentisate 1,2-dioxygenase